MTQPNDSRANVGFEPELVTDFCDEFTDASDAVQRILVEVESATDKHDPLHALFRALHSIKSNLRMMQLNVLSEYLHSLENILSEMRDDRIAYNERFSDVILLSLEQIEKAFRRVFAGEESAEHVLDEVREYLIRAYREPAALTEHLQAALGLMDPDYAQDGVGTQDQKTLDLEFFSYLMNFAERRLGYDAGIFHRILAMAEQMNALAGGAIAADELRTALYVHDLGMCFLPAQLVHKEGPLDAQELALLRQHPALGAELLSRLACWEEAATMVLQHHERYDGTGYPAGLAGGAICPGACLIAIVDTFEAMTHTRAHREHRRTVLRVVAEINAQSGKQFHPQWVDVFNRWIRQTYLKQT